MPSLQTLENRRQRLAQQISDHLDFLIGSISTKGFKYPAHNLTTKVDGKTKTRHIPKDMLPLKSRRRIPATGTQTLHALRAKNLPTSLQPGFCPSLRHGLRTQGRPFGPTHP